MTSAHYMCKRISNKELEDLKKDNDDDDDENTNKQY